MACLAFSDDGPKWGLGAGFGSTGIHLEGAGIWSDNWSTTLEGNFYTFAFADQTINTVKFGINLKLSSYALLMHWHPFGGGFHLSGGCYYNNNKMEIKNTEGITSIEIGHATYDASLSGSITFNKYTPYLGLGWGYKNATGMFVGVDAGAMFHGTPKLDLTYTESATGFTPDQEATISADMEREKTKMLADIDVSHYTIYPVLNLKLGWVF